MRGGVVAGTLVGGLCQPVERAPLGQFAIVFVLTTVLWPSLMGVSGSGVARGHGVARHVCAQWAMG